MITNQPAADALPYRFRGALAGGGLPTAVRVSLGGSNGNTRAMVLGSLRVVLNGVALGVDAKDLGRYVRSSTRSRLECYFSRLRATD